MWSDRSVTTLANVTGVMVVDADMDGSAELVFVEDDVDPEVWVGEDPNVDNSTLFVFGAAEGEWARSRPVWNQLPYDITTVRDDGAIVRFPRPSWSQYNAFRAQPAHDGDHRRRRSAAHEVCRPTHPPRW